MSGITKAAQDALEALDALLDAAMVPMTDETLATTESAARWDDFSARRDRLRAALQYKAGEVPKGYVLASETMDVQRLHEQLVDLTREAGAVDTVIGRPEVLRNNLAALRDEIGSTANGRIPLTAQPSPEAPAGGWPKLEKPATVGAGTFGVGVSSRLVVEAAQRAYKYKRENDACTKEEMQADEARRRSVWDMIHGALSAQPAPVVPDGFALVPVEPTDAMVQATFRLDLSYMPGQEGADRAAVYRAMLAASQQKGWQ